MSLLLVAFAVPQAWATVPVTVAEGNSNNWSSYYPVYGLDYDTQGTKSQMIYPSSLLSEMNGKRIVSITFYSTRHNTIKGIKFGDPNSPKGRGELTVRVATTNSVEFASSAYETLSNPISATVVPVYNSSELTVVFDDPITY